MKALVLCAGKGSRLGALCDHLPKPLLDIGGGTILDHILGQLASSHVDEVWINLHHQAQAIQDHLHQQKRVGFRIHFVEEPILMGTAGTPRSLLASLGDKPFLIHYGDILCDFDLTRLQESHQRSQARATILIHARLGSNSYVFQGENDRVVRFVERPSQPIDLQGQQQWAFSGICMISADCLSHLPQGQPADLPRDVFCDLAHSGGLFAQRLSSYRIAIDSPARLERVRRDVESGRFVPAWCKNEQRHKRGN